MLFGREIRIIVARGGERLTVDPNEFERFPLETGDRLSVRPATKAMRLIVTPDGCRHVPLKNGKAIRVPDIVEMAEFKGLRVPAHLVTLTGAGPETLDPIGKAHIANYRKFMGLEPGTTILEIGCGMGRDALQLIELEPPISRYIGVDVTWDAIAWCKQNISTRHPNFEFHHFNAKHELYNPLGTQTSLDFALPAVDASVDRVLLGSVFTHLFEDEVVHYLKEIKRVLSPNGLAYATFFLYSAETIEAAIRTDRTPFGLRFEHPHGEGCFISNPDYPTGAVAYTDEAMRRMINAAGLSLARPYLRGWWSGYYEEADDGQEVAILTPA